MLKTLNLMVLLMGAPLALANPHASAGPTPNFATWQTCLQIQGTWKGKCTPAEGTPYDVTYNLSQRGCEAVYWGGIEFQLGGSVVVTRTGPPEEGRQQPWVETEHTSAGWLDSKSVFAYNWWKSTRNLEVSATSTYFWESGKLRLNGAKLLLDFESQNGSGKCEAQRSGV